MLKIVLILCISVLSNQAIADIYKYVDRDGRTYYTDEPRNRLFKRIIKSKPHTYNTYTSYTFKNFSPRKSHYSSVNKKRFTDLIEQTASKYQVDPKLVHAVIQTESAYNSTAISSAGAVGLMQLMPETARRFGVIDRNDPDQNVEGGTRYLKHLINLFEPNLHLAVAAYNAGENAVMKYNNTIPPYPETQNYVKQVLGLYNR
ncbi:MAG: lytic transglycosylase domain-containing protein [Methylovulum sp.]|nr:lytic transglycosylase domain-containing protein [Methylovulum sp.]